MAENWYQKMAQVQEKIREYTTTGISRAEPDIETILAARVKELKVLREVVLQNEKNFYNSLNKTKPFAEEPKLALAALNEALNTWNSSGAGLMVSNNSVQMVLEILTSGEYRRLSSEEFENIANDFINEDEIFSNEAIENAKARIMDELNQALKEAGGPALSKKSREGAEYVYFTITEKDGKMDLKVDSNLRGDLKARLKKAFRLVMERHQKSTKGFSDAARNAQLVQRVILSKISDGEVRSCIQKELTLGRIEGYNLARDFNVIKGFLGEVYWSAFFSYLGANTLPTGDMKDDLSGQSIAIDLLINNYGFQVKNFNFKADGSISFGTRGGYKFAGTFIQDRASIDGKLGELLMDLYGSYAYNIDKSDGEFTDTRERLGVVLTEKASEIFAHYVDRIIRLDAEQSNAMLRETQGFVPDKNVLFNSFFVIGSKIIPSSAILTEIINAIENGKQNPAINFTITDLMIKEGAPQYAEKINWVSYKMANYTGISYNIDFNVDNILKKAYSEASK